MEACQVRELFQILFERPCRRTPDNLTGADNFRRQDSTSGAQHRARFDARLIADPNLPADHGVILYDDPAGKASLSRDYNVLSDAAVVPHMHHVIDLRA